MTGIPITQSQFKHAVVMALVLTGVAGCLLGTENAANPRSGSNASGVSNTPASVPINHGRLMTLNPIAFSGNTGLGADADFNSYLDRAPVFISNDARLEDDCSGNGLEGNISPCIEGKKDKNDTALAAVQNRWAFDANISEFSVVNTFGNSKQLINRYLGVLQNGYNFTAQPFNPPLTYKSAIPKKLYSSNAHWYGGTLFSTLGDCDQEDNAFFDTASFSICMGFLSAGTKLKMAQDPSVIHHEMGHVFHQVMLNYRNIAATLPERADIGYNSYDESASISEGLSDWMAHYMNGRSRIGEWGLGRFLGLARPVSESDTLHIDGITTDEDSRLSYPDFLTYEPNEPAKIFEDVHNAGMVASHFLTAFSKEMRDYCGMTFVQSVDTALYLNMEAYAEMGDLTAKASDHSKAAFLTRPTVNHSSDVNISTGIRTSEKWVSKVLPHSYRTWAQKFSKYAYQILSKNGSIACNGINYPVDRLERLLDSYGLLLFDNYNEDGNNFNAAIGQSGTSRAINVANRIKTVMVSKAQVKVDNRPDKAPAFIFDRRSEVLGALGFYQQLGTIGALSSAIPSDLPYNNGNGQVSPGEIVGLGLSLYNDSNSEIGGVQILANDWDHAKKSGNELKPCNIFEDKWPLSSEGAADVSTENPLAPTSGNCHFTTRHDGNPNVTPGGDNPPAEINEELAPICYVQVTENGTTRWADQRVLMSNLGVEPSKCLGGVNSTHDCFFRAIRGIDSAWYSRIAPKKAWGETIVDENNTPSFGPHNAMFFESSPDIPPGTTFECRFRVRFSNCKDCFTDDKTASKDDFRDFEYSGARPFKIVHYQFTVID